MILFVNLTFLKIWDFLFFLFFCNMDFYFEREHMSWSKFDWHAPSGEWEEVSADRHGEMNVGLPFELNEHVTICRQLQTNVKSISKADLHSFDLMWPGQSLIDMCTGSCERISHVGRQTERHVNSFEWRKWSNPHLFEPSLLPYSLRYGFHSNLKWVKRLWPTNLVFTCLSYLLLLLRH